jgi:hypothetical protein
MNPFLSLLRSLAVPDPPKSSPRPRRRRQARRRFRPYLELLERRLNPTPTPTIGFQTGFTNNFVLPDYPFATQATDATGHIFVPSVSDTQGAPLSVTRYNPDGSVDTTFGVHGTATIAVTTASSTGKAPLVRPSHLNGYE